MTNYIGIDLGTTNSAICSYDGENVRLWKSPDQNDVTPSAIFIDRRGNRYLGRRAYDGAAKNPDNAATRFKRMMGTSTPIKLPAVNLVMTPEECSAEILKLCYGYLPEEVRQGDAAGTVITVPAAFNQMQKDATMAAADMAGLGNVALMQEPVAAVMCIVKRRKGDGIFLVFDLGGGTLDIAIAESMSGRVNLLAHSGVAMCGGTDFDRAVLDNVVKPWLMEKFDLPDDLSSNPKYKTLLRMSLWAAERAKIELSANEEAVIGLNEAELGVRDESGHEIYIDVNLQRAEFDELIAAKVDEAIQSARETFEKAGLTAHDVERVVYVGGPTQYKPLRDNVARALGIAASTDVNPMTAVAEGAAIFAESIDWQSQSRGRKSSRGTVSAGGLLDLAFNYIARTPDAKARVVAKVGGKAAAGAEFQIDSLDTGWSSGRIALKDGATLEVTLAKPGDNAFKAFVFDSKGAPVALKDDKIVIARTAASIDAIPASHSMGVEARAKLGGPLVLDYLVKEGEQLPKRGKKIYRAEESLKAGCAGSITFRVWEGEITDPIHDNRLIGTFKLTGADFDSGEIASGAELVSEYEVRDSGNLVMEISVPSIGASFHSGRNFYSRQEGQIDYSNASRLVNEESEQTSARLDEMASLIDDQRLDQAKRKLEQAESLSADADPEQAKQAMDNVQEAKKLLALARKANLSEIRQMELDGLIEDFDQSVRKFARDSEATAWDNLSKTAQHAIDSKSSDFEVHLDDLHRRKYTILWRQDWWVIDGFKWHAQRPYLFPDTRDHASLVSIGTNALRVNDIDELRKVLGRMYSVRFATGAADDMAVAANIVMG